MSVCLSAVAIIFLSPCHRPLLLLLCTATIPFTNISFENVFRLKITLGLISFPSQNADVLQFSDDTDSCYRFTVDTFLINSSSEEHKSTPEFCPCYTFYINSFLHIKKFKEILNFFAQSTCRS